MAATIVHSNTDKTNGQAGLMADIGIVLAVIAIAALGGLVSGGSGDPWYVELTKPPLTPPGFVFGIVWPILYVLMAIGAVMVRRDTSTARNSGVPLGIFFFQLALNLAWSALFFYFHRPEMAFLDLIALLLSVLLMMFSFFKISKAAALLQVPYVLWLCFAGYINLGIIWLNT